MKMILLLSAAYANGGAFITASNTVPVGDDKLEITEERAEAMVSGNLAEIVPDETEDGEDTSPKKPAPRGAAAK